MEQREHKLSGRIYPVPEGYRDLVQVFLIRCVDDTH